MARPALTRPLQPLSIAFLFQNDPARRPNAFVPRSRTVSDKYNRNLASTFASPDRSWGRAPVTARWGHLVPSHFTPTDGLHVKGLQSRYRRSGVPRCCGRLCQRRRGRDFRYRRTAKSQHFSGSTWINAISPTRSFRYGAKIYEHDKDWAENSLLLSNSFLLSSIIPGQCVC
jgi:hypothetical protein